MLLRLINRFPPLHTCFALTTGTVNQTAWESIGTYIHLLHPVCNNDTFPISTIQAIKQVLSKESNNIIPRGDEIRDLSSQPVSTLHQYLTVRSQICLIDTATTDLETERISSFSNFNWSSSSPPGVGVIGDVKGVLSSGHSRRAAPAPFHWIPSSPLRFFYGSLPSLPSTVTKTTFVWELKNSSIVICFLGGREICSVWSSWRTKIGVWGHIYYKRPLLLRSSKRLERSSFLYVSN